MTVGAASSTPTLCINTALTAITHATTGQQVSEQQQAYRQE